MFSRALLLTSSRLVLSTPSAFPVAQAALPRFAPIQRSYGNERSFGGPRRDRGEREPAPPSESLFVGNLPFDCTEADIIDHFASYSPKAVRLAKDHDGRARGFAHIDFLSVSLSTAAKDELTSSDLLGRSLRIDFGRGRTAAPPSGLDADEPSPRNDGRPVNPPTKTLFIGGTQDLSSDTLLAAIQQVSPEVTVRVAEDFETGRPKGFAFAEFPSVEIAQDAMARLRGKDIEGVHVRWDFNIQRENKRGGFGGGGGGGGRGGFGGGGGGGGRGGFGGNRDRQPRKQFGLGGGGGGQRNGFGGDQF